jgi:acyl carrier protein
MRDVTPAGIASRIAARLSSSLDKPIDPTSDVEFDEIGLDSMAALNLLGELEEEYGILADPALPYDFPSLQSFATEISRIIRDTKWPEGF